MATDDTSPKTRSSIPERQNREENLVLRRAIAQIYFLAKKNLGGQIILTVILPMLVALASIFLPELRPFVAVLSIAALLIDIFYLDRRQKKLLRAAASTAERFDCNVLQIEWNRVSIGSTPSDAQTHEWSNDYKARVANDGRILDWYPIAVRLAPEHQARVMCQLTNAQYDGRLREKYRLTIGVAGILCVLSLCLAGLLARLTLQEFILIAVTPALPILLWSGREFIRQLETDGPLRDIQDRAFEAWNDTLVEKEDTDQLRTVSRALQDAIFGYRVRSPLPIPFIYSLLRNRLEVKMNVSAEQRLREAGIDSPGSS